jgi:hypothetical protein
MVRSASAGYAEKRSTRTEVKGNSTVWMGFFLFDNVV